MKIPLAEELYRGDDREMIWKGRGNEGVRTCLTKREPLGRGHRPLDYEIVNDATWGFSEPRGCYSPPVRARRNGEEQGMF